VSRSVEEGLHDFTISAWGLADNKDADEAAGLVERGEMSLGFSCHCIPRPD
jgi:hypothetical protein